MTTKISEPTQWCAGMVVVPKKSGKVRICVDLKPLNKSIMRETYPIPKVDDTLAQLTGARVFSKLDANSGFWQIPLAEESRPLTTFHHSGDTVSTNFHSEYVVHQRYSKKDATNLGRFARSSLSH